MFLSTSGKMGKSWLSQTRGTLGPNVQEQNGNKNQHFVPAMRTESQPFFDVDYAAIEARIVCWLAGQEDALKEYRDGVDRYKRMASAIYGVPEDEVNKHPQRFVGKQATLGCGFGMGPAKFRGTCEAYGYYDLPAGMEEKVVAIFRAKHQKVKSYWYLVENAAKRAIMEPGTTIPVHNVKFLYTMREGTPFLHICLPSGRKLSYPRAKIVPSRKFAGATTIQFFGHILGTKWGNVETYGGKLVENITQAVAADIMANGAMNAEKAGYAIATLIHDECVCYKKEGQTVEELVGLLTKLPKWGEGLPLEAEGDVIPFYKK